MTKFSYKHKIIIVVVLFGVFAIGMFTYGYGILDQRNQALADAATQRQSELEMLQREQRSFEQGQRDLGTLAKKPVPPEDLFSKDTKVVKEIKMLEEIATRFKIEFSLSIAGSTKTAPQVEGASSPLFVIPYTATLEGSFTDIMLYLQEAEHLPFVTHTKMLSLNALEGGNIRAILNSEFYIKK